MWRGRRVLFVDLCRPRVFRTGDVSRDRREDSCLRPTRRSTRSETALVSRAAAFHVVPMFVARIALQCEACHRRHKTYVARLRLRIGAGHKTARRERSSMCARPRTSRGQEGDPARRLTPSSPCPRLLRRPRFSPPLLPAIPPRRREIEAVGGPLAELARIAQDRRHSIRHP